LLYVESVALLRLLQAPRDQAAVIRVDRAQERLVGGDEYPGKPPEDCDRSRPTTSSVRSGDQFQLPMRAMAWAFFRLCSLFLSAPSVRMRASTSCCKLFARGCHLMQPVQHTVEVTRQITQFVVRRGPYPVIEIAGADDFRIRRRRSRGVMMLCPIR